MGFTLLQPPAPKAPTGVFKIATTNRKGSVWRVQITIPSAEFGVAFGAAERFDLAMGDGPDAGKLMIRAAEGGAFKAMARKKSFLFVLPPSDLTPEIDFSCDSPDRKATDGAMIVDLPNWAWEPGRWQAIRDARAVARRQDAAAQKQGR